MALPSIWETLVNPKRQEIDDGVSGAVPDGQPDQQAAQDDQVREQARVQGQAIRQRQQAAQAQQQANQQLQQQQDIAEFKANGGRTRKSVQVDPFGKAHAVEEKETDDNGQPTYDPADVTKERTGGKAYDYDQQGNPYQYRRNADGTVDKVDPFSDPSTVSYDKASRRAVQKVDGIERPLTIRDGLTDPVSVRARQARDAADEEEKATQAVKAQTAAENVANKVKAQEAAAKAFDAQAAEAEANGLKPDAFQRQAQAARNASTRAKAALAVPGTEPEDVADPAADANGADVPAPANGKPLSETQAIGGDKPTPAQPGASVENALQAAKASVAAPPDVPVKQLAQDIQDNYGQYIKDGTWTGTRDMRAAYERDKATLAKQQKAVVPQMAAYQKQVEAKAADAAIQAPLITANGNPTPTAQYNEELPPQQAAKAVSAAFSPENPTVAQALQTPDDRRLAMADENAVNAKRAAALKDGAGKDAFAKGAGYVATGDPANPIALNPDSFLSDADREVKPNQGPEDETGTTSYGVNLDDKQYKAPNWKDAVDQAAADGVITPLQAYNQKNDPYFNAAEQLTQARDIGAKTSTAGHWGQGVLSDQAADFLKVDEDANKSVDEDSLDSWNPLRGAQLIANAFGHLAGAAVGSTSADIKLSHDRQEAQRAIGNLDGPQAAEALRKTAEYSHQLELGQNITDPKDGGIMSAKLADLQESLKNLKSYDGSIGSADVFLENTMASLIPFRGAAWSASIDENNPEDVAKRAALVNGIQNEITRKFPNSALGGQVAGSLGQFMLGNKFGSMIADTGAGFSSGLNGTKMVAGSEALGTNLGYGMVGAAQSYHDEPAAMPFSDRILSISSQALTTGLSEGAGNQLEHTITHAFKLTANPIKRSLLQGVGGLSGEVTSDVLQNAAQGQDPFGGFWDSVKGNAWAVAAFAVLHHRGHMREAADLKEIKGKVAEQDSQFVPALKAMEKITGAADSEAAPRQADVLISLANLKNPDGMAPADATPAEAAEAVKPVRMTAELMGPDLVNSFEEKVKASAAARAEAQKPSTPPGGLSENHEVAEQQQKLWDGFNKYTTAYANGTLVDQAQRLISLHADAAAEISGVERETPRRTAQIQSALVGAVKVAQGREPSSLEKASLQTTPVLDDNGAVLVVGNKPVMAATTGKDGSMELSPFFLSKIADVAPKTLSLIDTYTQHRADEAKAAEQQENAPDVEASAPGSDVEAPPAAIAGDEANAEPAAPAESPLQREASVDGPVDERASAAAPTEDAAPALADDAPRQVVIKAPGGRESIVQVANKANEDALRGVAKARGQEVTDVVPSGPPVSAISKAVSEGKDLSGAETRALRSSDAEFDRHRKLFDALGITAERADFGKRNTFGLAIQGNKLQVDPSKLAESRAKLGPDAFQKTLRAALREEYIHGAAQVAFGPGYSAEVKGLWAGLGEEGRNAVSTAYGVKEASEEQLGGEYLRMLVQKAEDGTLTEQAHLLNNSALPKFLQKLLDYLHGVLAKNSGDPVAQKAVAQVQEVMRIVEGAPVQQASENVAEGKSAPPVVKSDVNPTLGNAKPTPGQLEEKTPEPPAKKIVATKAEAVSEANPTPAGRVYGDRTYFRTDNMKLDGVWELREAGSAKYAQGEDQNRKTDNIARRMVVDKIKHSLQPDRVTSNVLASEGASILHEDDTRLTGNTRGQAIEEAYTGLPGKHGPLATGEAYRAYLREHAPEWGFTAKQVDAMKNPELVRRITSPLTKEQRRKFVEEANEGTTVQFSPSEEAKHDQKALTPQVMSAIALSPDGSFDVNSIGNTEVAKAFFKSLPTSQRSKFINDASQLSPAGAERISNALLSSAYGQEEGEKLLKTLTETQGVDLSIARVAKSLRDQAPNVAKFANDARKGVVYNLQIGDDLAAAANKLQALRKSKTDPRVWLDNPDLGGDLSDPITPLRRAILSEMADDRGAHTAHVIAAYYDGARRRGNPLDEMDMGMGTPQYGDAAKLREWNGALESMKAEQLFAGPAANEMEISTDIFNRHLELAQDREASDSQRRENLSKERGEGNPDSAPVRKEVDALGSSRQSAPSEFFRSIPDAIRSHEWNAERDGSPAAARESVQRDESESKRFLAQLKANQGKEGAPKLISKEFVDSLAPFEINMGAEHRVYVIPDDSGEGNHSVVKITHPFAYGIAENMGDYLERMGWMNQLAPGLDIKALGFTDYAGSGFPSIVTSMTWVDGEHPLDNAELKRELTGRYGFREVGPNVYQHPNGVRIYDAHHLNFIKTRAFGDLIPIDIGVRLTQGDSVDMVEREDGSTELPPIPERAFSGPVVPGSDPYQLNLFDELTPKEQSKIKENWAPRERAEFENPIAPKITDKEAAGYFSLEQEMEKPAKEAKPITVEPDPEEEAEPDEYAERAAVAKKEYDALTPAQLKLVTDYKPLAINLADRFGNLERTTLDERLSIANQALVRAARAFDPDRGFKFGSLAMKTVKNDLIRLAQNEGRNRIDATLGESRNEEGNAESQTDNVAEGGQMFADGRGAAKSPAQEMHWSEMQKRIDRLVRNLPAFEAMAIRKVYLEGKTFAEAGKEMGYSGNSGILDLVNHAMPKLRSMMEDEGVTAEDSAFSGLNDDLTKFPEKFSKAFDDYASQDKPRPEWIRTGPMEMYIRKTKHLLPGEEGARPKAVDTVDIANVKVDEDARGKGLFRSALQTMIKQSPTPYVYVETIQNPDLEAALRRHPRVVAVEDNGGEPNIWLRTDAGERQEVANAQRGEEARSQSEYQKAMARVLEEHIPASSVVRPWTPPYVDTSSMTPLQATRAYRAGDITSEQWHSVIGENPTPEQAFAGPAEDGRSLSVDDLMAKVMEKIRYAPFDIDGPMEKIMLRELALNGPDSIIRNQKAFDPRQDTIDALQQQGYADDEGNLTEEGYAALDDKVKARISEELVKPRGTDAIGEFTSQGYIDKNGYLTPKGEAQFGKNQGFTPRQLLTSIGRLRKGEDIDPKIREFIDGQRLTDPVRQSKFINAHLQNDEEFAKRTYSWRGNPLSAYSKVLDRVGRHGPDAMLEKAMASKGHLPSDDASRWMWERAKREGVDVSDLIKETRDPGDLGQYRSFAGPVIGDPLARATLRDSDTWPAAWVKEYNAILSAPGVDLADRLDAFDAAKQALIDKARPHAKAEPAPRPTGTVNELMDLLKQRDPLDRAFLDSISTANPKKQVGSPELANPLPTSEARGVMDVVDENRKSIDAPSPRTVEEWDKEADQMLSTPEKYKATRDTFLNKSIAGEVLTAAETRAAMRITANEMLNFNQKTPEQRMEAYLMANAYRETGSDASDALRARIDPFRTPAERHRHYLAKMMFTPPASVRKAMRRKGVTIEQRKALLAGDASNLERMEKALGRLGVTMDDIFSGQAEVRLKGAQIVQTAIKGLSQREQRAAQMIREGMNPTEIAKATNLTAGDMLKVRDKVRADLAAKFEARVRKGFTADNLDAKGFGDQAAFAGPVDGNAAKSGMTDAQVRAEVEKMLDAVGFGKVPEFQKKTARKAQRKQRAAKVKPIDWSDDEDTTSNRFANPAPTNPADYRGSQAEISIERPEPRFDNPALTDPAVYRGVTPSMEREATMPTGKGAPFSSIQSDPFARAQQVIRQNEAATPTGQGKGFDSLKADPFAQGRQAIRQKEQAVPYGEGKAPARDEDLFKVGDTSRKGFDWGEWGKLREFDMNNPAHVLRVGRELSTAHSSAFDMAKEYWMASILSGLRTQIANLTGNTASFGVEYAIQRPIEAFLNAGLTKIGLGDPNAPQLGELSRVYKAFGPSMVMAGKNFVNSLLAGQQLFKADMLRDPMLFNSAVRDQEGSGPAIPGTLGKVVRIPFALLSAADDMFRTLIGQAEVHGQAYRLAKQQGLEGEKLEAFIKDEIATTGSESWHRTMAKADDLLFQKDLRSVEQGGNWVEQGALALAELTRKFPALSFVVPFIKTPYNIFHTGLRKTPLGTATMAWKFMREGWYKYAKDGAPNPVPYARGEQIRDFSEQALAWTAAALVYAASEGDDDDEKKRFLITGSKTPETANRGERDRANRMHGGSMTIRIGGQEFGYGRIEPAATTLTAMVDMVRSIKAMRDGKPKDQAMLGLLNFFKSQAGDKTYLRGLSDFLNVFSGGTPSTDQIKGAAVKAGADFVAGWVPNLIRQPLLSLDDYSRDTGQDMTFAERLRNNVLPAGDDRAKKIDIAGREVKTSEGGPLVRALVPGFMKPEDQTTLPLDRLAETFNRKVANGADPDIKPFNPEEPRRKFRWNKEDVELPADLFEEYKRVAGELLQKQLNWLTEEKIQNPTEADVERIKKAVQSSREGAKYKLAKKINAIPRKQ